MELKNKKIIFCFPYRGAGGVPLLFIRLGNYLNNIGYDVTIVDYRDGFMSLNNTDNLDFIEYKDNTEINIPDSSLLILQSMTPWSIYSSLKIVKQTKIFFITTIPTNLYPALPIFRDKTLKGGMFAKTVWQTVLRDEYQKMRRFIDLAIQKDSIIFLDDDVVCNIKNSLNVKIPVPKILPLFSENIAENAYLKMTYSKSDTFVVGWVGRIADFKVHILNKTIEDLSKYSQKYNMKIKYVIIGQGDREDELLNYNTENFSIDRIDHINPDALRQELLQFDLLFAMGTSALDGARLGVPTVRLDYDFKKIVMNYKYKFLYDVTGSSLGELISSKCYTEGLYTMEELVEKVLSDRNVLSIEIYDYYQKNHSLTHSAALFIDYINTSKLTWDDMEKADILESTLYNLWKEIRG